MRNMFEFIHQNRPAILELKGKMDDFEVVDAYYADSMQPMPEAVVESAVAMHLDDIIALLHNDELAEAEMNADYWQERHNEQAVDEFFASNEYQKVQGDY